MVSFNFSSDGGEHWNELNTGEIDMSTIVTVAMINDEIILGVVVWARNSIIPKIKRWEE